MIKYVQKVWQVLIEVKLRGLLSCNLDAVVQVSTDAACTDAHRIVTIFSNTASVRTCEKLMVFIVLVDRV